MFNKLTTLFKQLLDGTDLSQNAANNPNLAIASLLCEVAGADHQIDQCEQAVKRQLLKRLLNLSDDEVETLLTQAQSGVAQAASLYEFTSQLRELSQETRFALIKGMWEVAHADGDIDPLEDSVIRKTAELLYVDHREFIRAKLQVIDKS
ncbi:hypothetical protein BOO25_01550 [Vibrio navarrensis]|uniref:tellurite resistance TerB family protein n=1 Tax=Vibrio navarrensis TaxID=29495 RepID=UPI00192F3607|nr:TerB family tellurite resistance protein [Vibrio navarrensis]MBE3667628.1 hypothetical protein [Vibrio navarrensis]